VPAYSVPWQRTSPRLVAMESALEGEVSHSLLSRAPVAPTTLALTLGWGARDTLLQCFNIFARCLFARTHTHSKVRTGQWQQALASTSQSSEDGYSPIALTVRAHTRTQVPGSPRKEGAGEEGGEEEGGGEAVVVDVVVVVVVVADEVAEEVGEASLTGAEGREAEAVPLKEMPASPRSLVLLPRARSWRESSKRPLRSAGQDLHLLSGQSVNAGGATCLAPR
jgi:hypothetical protein